MSKCIAAGLMLLLLMAGSLYNIRCTRALTEQLSQLAEEAMASAWEGDFSAARERGLAAARLWRERGDYTHVFLRHTEVDGVTELLCELLGALYQEDAPGAVGPYLSLKEHLISIAAMENLRFGSIL